MELPRHRWASLQRASIRPIVWATALLLAIGSWAAVAVEAESGYPRAQALGSARHAANALERTISVPRVRLLLRAFGGEAGLQRFAAAAGSLFNAFGAAAAADAEWTLATEIARRRGDTDAYLETLAKRADVALGRGDYALCLDLAKTIQEVSRDAGDQAGTASAERYLGLVARRRGKLDEALARQQHALDLYRSIGDAEQIARSLNDLATVQRDRGDLTSALKAALEALVIRRNDGIRVDLGYRHLALLYRQIEDAAEAKINFERAFEAAGSANPLTYATLVGPWAALLNDTGDHAPAQAAAAEALAIDFALEDPSHQAFDHLELGRALLGQGKLDAARAQLDAALAVGRVLDQREIIARALLHLAEVDLRQRELLPARARLDEAVAGLEAAQLMPQIAQAYDLRSRLALAEDDYPAALRFAHKYTATREALLGARAARQVAVLEVRYQREQSEQRIALLAKDNELKAAQLETQRLEQRVGRVSVAALVLLLVVVAWRFASTIRANRALLAGNAEIERQRKALDNANHLLERHASELERAALTDSMTGVANRGHVFERLASLFEQCRRDGRELSVLLIDFDHFKQINDAHGHLYGDDILVGGVAAMRECLRPSDLIGRIGGEEFLVAVADCDDAEVEAVAERLRRHVFETLAARAPSLRRAATISIGVAGLGVPPRRAGMQALIEAADAALYAAKREGRNRVMRAA